MNNIKKMLSFYKPYMSVFLADMFFALVASGTTLVIPILVRYITQDVIQRPIEEAYHLFSRWYHASSCGA